MKTFAALLPAVNLAARILSTPETTFEFKIISPDSRQTGSRRFRVKLSMIALTEILETCTWPVRLGPTSSHMDFREFQTLESLVHQTLGGRIPNINLSVALEFGAGD